MLVGEGCCGGGEVGDWAGSEVGVTARGEGVACVELGVARDLLLPISGVMATFCMAGAETDLGTVNIMVE